MERGIDVPQHGDEQYAQPVSTIASIIISGIRDARMRGEFSGEVRRRMEREIRLGGRIFTARERRSEATQERNWPASIFLRRFAPSR